MLCIYEQTREVKNGKSTCTCERSRYQPDMPVSTKPICPDRRYDEEAQKSTTFYQCQTLDKPITGSMSSVLKSERLVAPWILWAS